MNRPPIPFIRHASALALAALVCVAPRARAQHKSAAGPADSIAVHLRVIGVFDDQTGEPIPGVEVKDVFTGLSAITTSTGTVALPLDTSGAFLRVRKVGYLMRTYPVQNAVRDTTPVTLTIDAILPQLPTVHTRARGIARGPADTVMRLERTGFYERREYGAAPPSAYVSEEQLNRWAPTMMTDIGRYSGRAICTDNLYIDGARVTVPGRAMPGGRVSRVLKQGLDALLDPSMIAGIETYRTGELPPQFNATGVGEGAMSGGSSDCVTLIWTR
ncbi:MAG TPA: hypothetical protein VNE60_11355 [Gemmatimonadaceae bacterium]|nr:hypothetical protein [Gemmatimonadaceae bacterium]